jgi:hypothetical protein
MKPFRDEPIISESTQSVSAASKIPMDLDEFKGRYNQLLDSYIGENKYYNELTFVKMWFSRYSKLSDLLQKTSKPEPLTLIEKRGLKALGTKNHYSNLELSFSLICKFLKQKRKQVKAELKLNLEPPQQNEILNLNEVKKKKPDSKIPHTVMNEAILSIQASMVDDIKTPQQHEAVKLDQVKKNKSIKPKNEFKDFFNTDVSVKVIEKIQDDFKEYYGKKMAMLIYLLETEFKLISYSLDSKTDSRKHFVDSLNKSKINMQPINIFFVTHTYKLGITKFEENEDFVRIKEKLQEAIK